MSDKMPELLPCEWCKRSVELNDYGDMFTIRCNGATTAPHPLISIERSYPPYNNDTKLVVRAEIIKTWNTRTVAPADDERDAMIETIAELERDRDALREVARMSLHQLEFQYGKRKRGWDAAFLMERLNRAISDSEGSDTTPPAASGPQTAPDDAKPVGDLHLSVCDAVALLNQVVHKQEESRQAHDILRQALVDYADSARPAQPSAPETPDPETEAVARGIRLDLCHCLDAHKAPNGFAVEAVTCVTHQAITAALTSTRSQLLKQIREAVEAEQVEDDGSGVWDAGHYDGINDALAAIDKVANETSET